MDEKTDLPGCLVPGGVVLSEELSPTGEAGAPLTRTGQLRSVEGHSAPLGQQCVSLRRGDNGQVAHQGTEAAPSPSLICPPTPEPANVPKCSFLKTSHSPGEPAFQRTGVGEREVGPGPPLALSYFREYEIDCSTDSCLML